MAFEDTKTEISKNGLRYKSKVSGSPFGGASGSTMSCYKCGKHKPRSSGSLKRVIGQITFVCGDCKPLAPESK